MTGGEPVLAPGLLRRCIRHARRRADPGTSLALAVTTNGPVLPRDRARFLAEHDVALVPDSLSGGREHSVTLLRAPLGRELPSYGDLWCSAGSPDGLAGEPDGTAWACPWWAKSLQRLPAGGEPVAEALSLGDVRDAGFDDRLAALPTRAAGVRVLTHRRSRRSPLAECGSCPGLSICPACPASTVREPGNTDPDLVPAAVCALTRASARARASLTSILRELAELSERLSTLAARHS